MQKAFYRAVACSQRFDPAEYDLPDMQNSVVLREWTFLPLEDEIQIDIRTNEKGEYDVTRLVGIDAILRAGPKSMCWITIYRSNFSEDDHYSNGSHTNMLMKFSYDMFGRFEPYFAATIAETRYMESVIDNALRPLLGDVYHGSTSKFLKYGPQMLTDSAPDKCENEDMCAVWCILAAIAIDEGGCETLAEAATAVYNSLPCRPTNDSAARKCSPKVMTYARDQIEHLFTPIKE